MQEGRDVRKLPVYGGKADVGDFIQGAQRVVVTADSQAQIFENNEADNSTISTSAYATGTSFASV